MLILCGMILKATDFDLAVTVDVRMFEVKSPAGPRPESGTVSMHSRTTQWLSRLLGKHLNFGSVAVANAWYRQSIQLLLQNPRKFSPLLMNSIAFVIEFFAHALATIDE